MTGIFNTTPGGYLFMEPITTGQPDVHITLPYEDAFDIVLDGLTNDASTEPLTEGTFKLNTVNLLGLLIDASEDLSLPESDSPEALTAEQMAEYRQRITTERILRSGDPYYDIEHLVDGTPTSESSAWERAITPDAVSALLDEIVQLRTQLAGGTTV